MIKRRKTPNSNTSIRNFFNKIIDYLKNDNTEYLPLPKSSPIEKETNITLTDLPTVEDVVGHNKEYHKEVISAILYYKDDNTKLIVYDVIDQPHSSLTIRDILFVTYDVEYFNDKEYGREKTDIYNVQFQRMFPKNMTTYVFIGDKYPFLAGAGVSKSSTLFKELVSWVQNENIQNNGV